VIVDSPPLGAGTDAYALGTATTNVALVMRRAATDLKLAEAKLQVFDQLPAQVIGAVLNEVDSEAGMYQYFSDPDYVPVLPAGRSRTTPTPAVAFGDAA
jgi:succinoglycan biosynthesis transport protein ExoP